MVQIGDSKVDNMTLNDFKKALSTPILGLEGYNTILVFQRESGQLYRLPAETMRINILKASSHVGAAAPMPLRVEPAAPVLAVSNTAPADL